MRIPMKRIFYLAIKLSGNILKINGRRNKKNPITNWRRSKP